MPKYTINLFINDKVINYSSSHLAGFLNFHPYTAHSRKTNNLSTGREKFRKHGNT